MEKNKHIVIIEVENKPGVLTRVTALCRRRRYNIESLTVSTTKNPEISQITLVFFCQVERINQIINQIDKLIEVISIEKANPKNSIDKELVLLIVKNQKTAQELLTKTSKNINIKIIQDSKNPIIEIISSSEIIENIIKNINKKDILKIVRSGVVALKTQN